MEDLFRSYWWLLFPLGWFVASGWQSWLAYRARRDSLKLVQTYAERGQEPPADLLRSINRQDEIAEAALNGDGAKRTPSRTNWGWYQVVLFGALAAGFVFMSQAGILGDQGLADVLLIAAVVLGALALASLVAALTYKGPKA